MNVLSISYILLILLKILTSEHPIFNGNPLENHLIAALALLRSEQPIPRQLKQGSWLQREMLELQLQVL